MSTEQSPNARRNKNQGRKPAPGEERPTPLDLKEDLARNHAAAGGTVEAAPTRVTADDRAGSPAQDAFGRAVGRLAARVQQGVQVVADNSGPFARQTQARAAEAAGKARRFTASHDGPVTARRGGAAAAAAAGTAVVAVWVRRRRQARRLTRWQSAARTAQQAGTQIRDQVRDKVVDRAAELGTAVAGSDLAAQAAARGQDAAAQVAAGARRAAAAPDTRPRVQGAALATAVLLALAWLRRRRAARTWPGDK
jgi:hypothetical protein